MSITAQRAEEFGIDAQRQGEHNQAFRERVSGALRTQGHIIEAHEAMQNRLYDDPDGGGDVMGGVMGAMAQALHGTSYGTRAGHTQVGDDIAVGAIVKDKQENPPMSAEILLIAALMAR